MLEVFQRFLKDNEYQIIINKCGLYIKNYQRLISLEDTNISLITSKKKIVVSGEGLSLRKILDNELFIQGLIKRIEVFDV